VANGITPMFGWSNRSMYTVPVSPSKSAAGVKALRAKTAAAVKAQSTPVSVGAKSYPNGKRAK
jgi:hypothetical protein